MKTKSKLSFVLSVAAACLTLSALSACEMGGGDDEEDTPSEEQPAPSDGSQSRAELAGARYNCEILSSSNSDLNGKAVVRYLSLNADGTYSGMVMIANGTSCSYGHSPNDASQISQYNFSGTWTVNGTNTSPSAAATKIQFIPMSTTFTVRNPTSNAAGQALVAWANGCTGGTGGGGFSTTSFTTKTDFFPTVCNAVSGVNFHVPPSLNVMQYNIATRNTSFEMGAIQYPNQNIWSPNAGSYLSSFSGTWF